MDGAVRFVKVSCHDLVTAKNNEDILHHEYLMKPIYMINQENNKVFV